MQLRYRLYPYPILSEDNDDYVDSKFEVNLDNALIGNKLHLEFNTELKNEVLENLVKKGDVEFVYHLESSEAGFRTTINTRDKGKKHTINLDELGNQLQICPFLIAERDIKNYTNEKFHSDYRGLKFSIEKGCVLGFSSQYTINLVKENELGYTPSIFSIIKDKKEDAQGLLVDFNNNKIVIKIPEIIYYKLDLLKENIALKSIINSLIVFPALLYVLEEISKISTYERYNFESYSWYRSINNALKSGFSCDFESEKFKNLNYLEVAQEMINTPFDNAITNLASGYIVEDEEDFE